MMPPAVLALLLLAARRPAEAAAAGDPPPGKWEITFEPPVLVSGAINTSSALGSIATRRNIVTLSDSLSVPCLFFPIERYAKNIFSIEQDYGIGNLRYTGPPDQSWQGTPLGNRPYVYSSECPIHVHRF
eukprot:SAG22_NODE_395_length_11139_cov_14.562500_7_plen_129_part_00